MTGALSEEAVRYLTDGGFQPRTLKGITTYSDIATATTFMSFNPEALTSTGITQEAAARRMVPAEFRQLAADAMDGAMLGEMTQTRSWPSTCWPSWSPSTSSWTSAPTGRGARWVEGLVQELIDAETQDHMAWLERFIHAGDDETGSVEYGWDQVIACMKSWGIVTDHGRLAADDTQPVTAVWLAGQAQQLPRVKALLAGHKLDSRRHGTRFGQMAPLPMPEAPQASRWGGTSHSSEATATSVTEHDMSGGRWWQINGDCHTNCHHPNLVL